MALQLRDKKEFNPNWTKRETKIAWLVDGNPKRPHGKSYARFERYFGALTVGEYYDGSGTKGDLRHDWQHWFLDLIEENEPVKPKTFNYDKITAEKSIRSINESTDRLLGRDKAPNESPNLEAVNDDDLDAQLVSELSDLPELETADITEEELLAS